MRRLAWLANSADRRRNMIFRVFDTFVFWTAEIAFLIEDLRVQSGIYDRNVESHMAITCAKSHYG